MLWSVVHISAEPVCMAYFTVPPSNPVPLGTATLPGPLPVSSPLSFNLAAAKTASSDLGMTACRKPASAKLHPHKYKKQTNKKTVVQLEALKLNPFYFIQNSHIHRNLDRGHIKAANC